MKKQPIPQIVPIGLNGNFSEAFEALINQADIPVILDDAEKHQGHTFSEIPIVPISKWVDYPQAQFLFFVGSDKSFQKRAEIILMAGIPAQRFTTFSHPLAEISGFAEVGRGTIFYSGVIVTSNGRIGNHVLVMPRAILHHDVQIGSHSIIGSGVLVAGGAIIGDNCYVGSGSVIRNGISIGNGALVGLGSVVVRDVPPGAVVAGNPARILNSGTKS